MSSPDAPDLDAIEALYAEWQNPDSRVSLASIGTEAVRALPVLVAALREARTEIQIHAECMDAWDRQSAALRAAETKLAAIQEYATALVDQTADDYEEVDTKAEIAAGLRLQAILHREGALDE